MTYDEWEARARCLEKLAAGWLRMATERKQQDATQEYYFSETRRLMDLADRYRKTALLFAPKEAAE